MKSLGQVYLIGSLIFDLVTAIGYFTSKLKFNYTGNRIKIASISMNSRDLSLLIKYNIERRTFMLEDLIESIERIEKSVILLVDLQLQQSNNLNSYTDVAKFLGKTTKTIYNYIKNGKLQENIHYTKDVSQRIVFNPKAIVDFKNNSFTIKPANRTDNTNSRVIHPVALKMLEGVA